MVQFINVVNPPPLIPPCLIPVTLLAVNTQFTLIVIVVAGADVGVVQQFKQFLLALGLSRQYACQFRLRC